MSTPFAPGIRITARGEDFLITKAEEDRDGTYLMDVEGISKLGMGECLKFDSRLEISLCIKPGA